MTTQIWLSIGLISYYIVLQIYDDFVRVSTKTNTKSRLIEKLRIKYKIPIRTFYAKRPFGFASFRSIWINDIVLQSENPTIFTFYHEYYHLKKHHKSWLLFMRFIVAIAPLAKYFVNWGLVVLLLLTTAYTAERIRRVFEKKANEYANLKATVWKEQ